MAIKRYCIQEGCPGADGCTNKYRRPGHDCTMEYVAAPDGDPKAKFNWLGEGPPPSRWMVGNTLVYRCFDDYCD